MIPSNSQKANVLTHCRRELMHGVWNKLLDDDFVNAYRHGFTMECLDGVWRRFYPRIFTYSADYPEKCVRYPHSFCTPTDFHSRALLATIRNNGDCPCPRCLVKKADIYKIGQVNDIKSRLTKARKYVSDTVTSAIGFIYKQGFNVVSAAVDRVLSAQSLVPTKVCGLLYVPLCIG